MKAVELAFHEFSANYLFDDHALKPFFACDSRVKDGDGSQVGAFEIGNERWVVKLYYQDSGIVHPGDDGNGNVRTGTENRFGTPFRIEELREFRFAVSRHPDEDPVEQQSFNAHLAPRWQGMQVENKYGDRSEYSVPDPITEAVNVKIDGSNIDFRRYHELLCRAAEAVGIHRRYFDRFHPFSNVQDAERYARVDKDRSGPIHARDGPIASLSHLLENDRDGYRKLVQNERDENGRHLPGYYHTVTLGPRRVSEAFPGHDFPREIKHYYSRHAAEMHGSEALAHPKLGASYQVNRWDDAIGLEADSLDSLIEQLDETVHSVLAEAGIPVHPSDDDRGDGHGPFVPDAYFDPSNEQETDIVSLDLTHIRQEQESIVVRHLADGLSPVQWETMETLVTDGGTVSPTEIADENGRHVDSVRRALREIPELVEAEYGSVSLRSEHIAELVHDAVKEARDAIGRAADAGAKAIEAAKRGVDEGTSALIAWCAKHGIDVDDRTEARMVIRLQNTETVHDARQRLREAYELWCEAGKDPVRFRQAQVERKGGIAAAHHFLDANRGGDRYVRHTR